MKKISIYGSLLGLTSAAGVLSYFLYDFENKSLEQLIERLGEKTKNLVAKIKKQTKNFQDKEKLKKLFSKSLSLKEIENEINKDDAPGSNKGLKIKIQESKTEIEKLKKEIQAQEKNNKTEEIYKEIEGSISLMLEIHEKVKKFEKDKDNLFKQFDENDKNLEELENLNLRIHQIYEEISSLKIKQDFEDVENLKEQASKKQKEMETILKNKNFENLEKEVKIWLDLGLKIQKLLIFYFDLKNAWNT